MHSASINLVHTKVNVLDEIIKWSLTVGRLLVILTELVAFSTFIMRFSLDRQLIDLHTKVRQEQNLVASLSQQESAYRSLQQRLTTIKKVDSTGTQYYNILNDVVDLTPNEITFTNFAIEDKEIRIESQVKSIDALSVFISSLRKYPKISNVGIDKIDNKDVSGAVNVSITAKLK